LTIKICVSIIPQTLDEAVNLTETAQKYKPDFIEVRLDYIDHNIPLTNIASVSKVPLIATARSPNEAGYFMGSETERHQLLLNAARNGFEYIDIELFSPKLEAVIKTLRTIGAKPIISYHDFQGTPSLDKLQAILIKQLSFGANLYKIVTTARLFQDNLIVLNFTSQASKRANIICFSMGAFGKPSRLLSPLFGGFFTMASLETGKATATGQLTILEMRTIYQILGTN
jgi:3-dehydroquinate dehydratase type I